MDTTSRLQLPYIAPQQAQKQVTFNEAMAVLDQLVQPTVISRTVTAPPGSPVEGDAYVVAPSATGAWAGKDNEFACWLSGAWSFRAVADGWLAYVVDAAEIAIYASGAWSTLVSNGGGSVAKFGVHATADLTNRLAVGGDASLFTHDGTSHRMKINKASAADTASLLYQDNFSGRAEFGLTGDDAFHIKVSPNGSTWYEALTIAQGSGLVNLPIGQLAFPATQNPSSNANTLDDYEEGTWTPTLSFGGASVGITYSSPMGRYTKIGRMVFFSLSFSLTSKGSSTGAAKIDGLPFTATAAPHSSVTCGYFSTGSAIVGAVTGMAIAASTSISLYQTNNYSSLALTNANFNNTSAVYFSGCYDAS